MSQISRHSGVVCYDADFAPYGQEFAYVNSCTQNVYKFEGKERDTETGNDDFGARYYSNRMGRWLSADWSAVPAPVPYANLTNPQTLNLYAMVADDPETSADLDGHWCVWGIGTTCNQAPPPPPPPPPPSANTTVANIYRFGPTGAALGAVGNAAQSAADATKVTGSATVGNVNVDNKGEASAVADIPALAVNVNVTVNGPRSDQEVIEQPGVAAGKFVGLSTFLVKDKDSGDNVHLQGGNLSVGVGTPTAPINTSVPIGNINEPQSPIGRALSAISNFLWPAAPSNPQVPWNDANPL